MEQTRMNKIPRLSRKTWIVFFPKPMVIHTQIMAQLRRHPFADSVTRVIPHQGCLLWTKNKSGNNAGNAQFFGRSALCSSIDRSSWLRTSRRRSHILAFAVLYSLATWLTGMCLLWYITIVGFASAFSRYQLQLLLLRKLRGSNMLSPLLCMSGALARAHIYATILFASGCVARQADSGIPLTPRVAFFQYASLVLFVVERTSTFFETYLLIALQIPAHCSMLPYCLFPTIPAVWYEYVNALPVRAWNTIHSYGTFWEWRPWRTQVTSHKTDTSNHTRRTLLFIDCESPPLAFAPCEVRTDSFYKLQRTISEYNKYVKRQHKKVTYIFRFFLSNCGTIIGLPYEFLLKTFHATTETIWRQTTTILLAEIRQQMFVSDPAKTCLDAFPLRFLFLLLLMMAGCRLQFEV